MGGGVKSEAGFGIASVRNGVKLDAGFGIGTLSENVFATDREGAEHILHPTLP